MTLVEAAAESVEAAIAAERAGAQRLELCADLANGGTTPDSALTEAVLASVRIPVFVMVRVRAGDFTYSATEIAAMVRELEAARSAGAAGIVTGALTTTDEIDCAAMRELMEAAHDLPVTFHRAFDRARDSVAALEDVIDVGASRILTSGAARTALEGVGVIAKLVSRSAGRIAIVAGGGVRANNVREVIGRTGVREVHSRMLDEAQMRSLVELAGYQ